MANNSTSAKLEGVGKWINSSSIIKRSMSMQLLHEHPRSGVSWPYLKAPSDSRTPGRDEVTVPIFAPSHQSLGVHIVLWRSPVTQAEKG